MKDEKDLKKVNEEEKEVEGYVYCDSHKEKCMNDCVPSGPFLSPLQ